MSAASAVRHPSASSVPAVCGQVDVVTSSRLSMGLLDLNGALGRVDGSFGLSISAPRVVVKAEPDEGFRVSYTGGTLPEEADRRATRLLSDFAARFAIGGTHVIFEEVIPPHSGLGSGTQLSLAVASALNALYGLNLGVRDLAQIAGRGGTSGLGVAAFRAGGFVLEGGHRFGGVNGKSHFAPSAASAGIAPGPVLFRHAFPEDWSVLVAIPDGLVVCGESERALFAKLCPLPGAEVADLSRIVLLQLLPALVEGDIETFGHAVEATQEVGFKRHEIVRQSAWVSLVRQEMRRAGLHGVGMSSWGPALFGFGSADETAAAEERLNTFMARGRGGRAFVTSANNAGAGISTASRTE